MAEAAAAGAGEEERELPMVLLLRPILSFFDEALTKKYTLLKPWLSTLPLHQFLPTHARSAKVLLCSGLSPVDAATISALPALQYVVSTTAGVDHIDIAECRRRGIAVTNAGDAFSEDVAEYAVALLLDVLCRFSTFDRFVRRGLWPSSSEESLACGRKLSSKHVGIVGLGRIGSKVAKRLEGFGCRISYTSRRKKLSVTFPFYGNVCDLAAENDAIVLCCELNDETHHLINRDVLLALGKGGVVINVGRGALIDEKELIRCLVQGEVGGAGLDVFEDEPRVPPELMSMDNVVLSPHRAALTPESFQALLEVVEGNLDAFFSNRPLFTPVLE